MRNQLNPIFYLLISTAVSAAAQPAEKGFRATAQGNFLEVTTPYGTRLYFGDPGFGDLNSYQVEIPIEDFRPPTQTAGPSQPPGQGATNPGPTPYEEPTDHLITRANQLYNHGKFNAALDYIEELLRREPGNTRGWVMKGSLLHALGQKDLAKKSWQKAQELDPSNQQLKNILQRY